MVEKQFLINSEVTLKNFVLTEMNFAIKVSLIVFSFPLVVLRVEL